MLITELPQDKLHPWLLSFAEHNEHPELVKMYKSLEVISSQPGHDCTGMIFGNLRSPDAVIIVNNRILKQFLRIGEYNIPLFQYSALQLFPSLIYIKTGSLNNYLAEIQKKIKPADAIYAYNVFIDNSSEPSLANMRWQGYHSGKLNSKVHPLLNLHPTYDEYLQFKKQDSLFKHQLKNNLRNIKKMTRELQAEPEFERITQPEQVEHFLEQAEKIARKTYKWELLNLTIHNDAATQTMFKRLAEQGLLRCYLLKIGTEYIAYNQSYQIDNHVNEVARSFDPKYSQYSAGHVLTHLFIKDLHEFARPKQLDSGDGNGFHKDIYATEMASSAKVMFIRYNLKGYAMRAVDAINDALRGIIVLLNKMGIKERIKTWFRRRFQASKTATDN